MRTLIRFFSGISVSEGPGSQVQLRNEGLVIINGLASQSDIVIAPGVGIELTTQPHGVTLSNPFFIPPCTFSIGGLSILWNIAATGSYIPLTIGWGPFSMAPANCYNSTPIFLGIPGPLGIYGQFNMPPGIWTMDGTIVFFLQNGLGVQLNLQFRNYFYVIQLPSVNFYQPPASPGTSGYFQHHFSMTLSDREIPAGSQFSLHFTSTGTPTSSVVFFSEFSMTKIA
jgi:hypothetical protein